MIVTKILNLLKLNVVFLLKIIERVVLILTIYVNREQVFVNYEL